MTGQRLLRAAVIDDEPMARARLCRLLHALDRIEVVAECADGVEAAKRLATTAVDVAFVDIRMPEVDGFALVDRLPPQRRPLLVFVTAYAEHALRAFDARALDYLLKPYSAERLAEAVARVRERLRDRTDTATPTEGRYAERLAVPDGHRLRMLPVDEIERIVAQRNYLELHGKGRCLLLREPLATLMARLDPKRFLRVHRSRAVRIDCIEQVELYGAARYWLRLRDGTGLSTGRSYRAAVRKALGLDSEPP